jgi:hypothetical protein
LPDNDKTTDKSKDFPSIRHEPHRKWYIQFLSCVFSLPGKMFTEPLPGIESKDTSVTRAQLPWVTPRFTKTDQVLWSWLGVGEVKKGAFTDTKEGDRIPVSLIYPSNTFWSKKPNLVKINEVMSLKSALIYTFKFHVVSKGNIVAVTTWNGTLAPFYRFCNVDWWVFLKYMYFSGN